MVSVKRNLIVAVCIKSAVAAEMIVRIAGARGCGDWQSYSIEPEYQPYI